MMGKRLRLATRGFGAEPGVPELAALASWIAEHRGMAADITTYRLQESLSPQLAAGIGMPCAGGRFYADRLLMALGVPEGIARGEIHADPGGIAEDAAGIVVRSRASWCAMPAPHALGIADEYYHDADEWQDAICGAYRSLMRAMRDTGLAGHVLICEKAVDAELALLARQKIFFFQPGMDMRSCEVLMEYQHRIAVDSRSLDMVFALADRYPLAGIVLIDPDPASIDHALSRLDPDQVVAGGYCTEESCRDYWKVLAEGAVYIR